MMKVCEECEIRFEANRAPRRFCGKPCAQRSNARKGRGVSGLRGRHRLKTGRRVDRDGYFRVLTGSHPFKRKTHYMLEHVRTMETSIGRRILLSEVVHHRDHNRQNNALSNLELMDRSTHSKLHAKRARDASR
jgi:hypothetical protein